MNLEGLAKKLSDPKRIGLTEHLVQKLGILSEDATRGRLMAQVETDRSHLGVYLLAAYVVDDTDIWGDGEVYWWSIPTMVRGDGSVTKNILHGLPTGAEPHKVGSLEWMSNLSLKDPPLLAVIPPEEEITACTLRIAFYDDDGKPAKMEDAISEGLEAFGGLSDQPLPNAEHMIAPIRTAICQSLKVEEDDILIDQDVTIRRGNAIPFASGMIGSVINSMARAYYLVNDESNTEQFGPMVLHKGQSELVRFDQPIKAGGRLAIFARGADVHCGPFGELNVDTPFQNRVIDATQEAQLANGFPINAMGASKFVAYYTPG